MVARWLPVLLLVCVAAQLAFFVFVAVFPLTTVGDPAFDRPWLRAQSWVAFQQMWVFLAGCVLVLLVFLRRGAARIIQAFLALMPLCLAHVVLVSELGWLTRHGGLAVERDLAITVLDITRPGCAILALISLVALWRLDASRASG